MTRRRRIVFAVLPLLGLLLLTEVGLRVSGYRYDSYFQKAFWWTRLSAQPIYQRDPALFWRLRPYANSDLNPESRDTQLINSLGFRDDEFSRRKPAGVFRAITMGDSCTFGDGVANWETYANVLEELLAARNAAQPVEVINAGVPGYTSYQARTYLENELLDFDPNLVIVYVGFNDNVPATNGVTDAQRGAVDRSFFAFQETLGRLRTYQLLKFGMLGVKRRLLPNVHPEAKNVQGVEHHIFRVPEEDFVANLVAIKKLGEQRGFATIVVTLPHAMPYEPERNPQIRKAAAAAGLELVDLYPLMKVHQNDGEQLYGPDGGHPNALGQRRIAEALLAKMIELGLAPASGD